MRKVSVKLDQKKLFKKPSRYNKLQKLIVTKKTKSGLFLACNFFRIISGGIPTYYINRRGKASPIQVHPGIPRVVQYEKKGMGKGGKIIQKREVQG